MKVYSVCLFLLLIGCVSVDPQTGETLPRGDQKYDFATVERRAEHLQPGMSKLEVLFILGSPAESDAVENVWIYLPERPAVLIPSHALRLEFENDLLIKHGRVPILLGQPL